MSISGMVQNSAPKDERIGILSDYAARGHGDGIYEFFVQATDNINQTQPFDPATGTGGSVILDLTDQIQPAAYLPIIHNSTPD